MMMISVQVSLTCSVDTLRSWGTADVEIKVHSVENPDRTDVLLLKQGVVQNVASHASPTARILFHVLILPSWATEGALFISAQLSSDAVSALRKFRVLI